MRWRTGRGREENSSSLPSTTTTLLDALPLEWAIVDEAGRLLRTSPRFRDLGLTRRDSLAADGLLDLVARARLVGSRQSLEFPVGGAALSGPLRRLQANAGLLPGGSVLVTVDDVSAASRVDAMRRDFIASVAGELQEPTNELLHLAENLSAGDGKQLRKNATRIEREAMRLTSLIADLTDLSRLQAADVMGQASVIDIRGPIIEAADSLVPAANAKRIDIIRDVSELHIHGNADQLTTAVRNLIANAIAYSPSHTAVTVSARAVDEFVEISVKDEGVGIPEEHQHLIFDRFHRVDSEASREAGGTGLGLAIVKQICAAHGGEVSVASAPGRGSLFTMRFPAVRRDEASSVPWQEVS